MLASGPSSAQELIYSTLREDPDFAELLPFYVDELPEKRSELRLLKEVRDFESLRKEAHKLRGSAGGYGFQGLSDLAGRLEETCKIPNQDAESILKMLDELLEYLAKVRA